MKSYTAWRRFLAWVGLVSLPVWAWLAYRGIAWLVWAHQIVGQSTT
jgi:hypothetical protein